MRRVRLPWGAAAQASQREKRPAGALRGEFLAPRSRRLNPARFGARVAAQRLGLARRDSAADLRPLAGVEADARAL